MGGVIGTIVSGCFLLFIGILNAIVLFDLQKVFLKMRKGTYNEEEVEELLLNRGFVARFAGPLFRFINKSWHVYPLGFLFGLGFDTASEVALLAISAGAAKSALPLVGILIPTHSLCCRNEFNGYGRWGLYDQCLPLGIFNSTAQGVLQFNGYYFISHGSFINRHD